LTWLQIWVNTDLLWTDKNQENYFYNESFFYWEKTNLTKSEFYKWRALYTNENLDINFYSNELNFVSIKKDWKNEFLNCNYIKNTNLNWSIEDIKLNDVVFLYEPYQKEYNISIIEHNNNSWKKVKTTNIYKNSEWTEDIFKVESIYFVPNNKNLESYYNLYYIVDIYWDTLKFFKLLLEEKLSDSSNIKELYNKDDIFISKYKFENWEKTWKYGLKYTFVNWNNYLSDFNELRRYKLFNYLLSINSSLVKKIYSFEYEELDWNESSNIDYFWVKYNLWLIKQLPIKSINAIPYYSNFHQLVIKNYNNVSDYISKDKFYDYIDSKVYWDYQLENLYEELTVSKILKNLKTISIDDNFSDIKNWVYEYEKQEIEKQEIEKQKIEKQNNIELASSNNKLKVFIIILVVLIIIWVLISFGNKKKHKHK
jgi:hypothetical protein